LSDSYEIWHALAGQISPLSVQGCGRTAINLKIGIYLKYKYWHCLYQKSWLCVEKLEYRCTATNLPLHDGSKQFGKLHCLVAFPFFTNSVIRTVTSKQKNIILVQLEPACDVRSLQTRYGDRRCPSRFNAEALARGFPWDLGHKSWCQKNESPWTTQR